MTAMQLFTVRHCIILLYYIYCTRFIVIVVDMAASPCARGDFNETHPKRSAVARMS